MTGRGTTTDSLPVWSPRMESPGWPQAVSSPLSVLVLPRVRSLRKVAVASLGALTGDGPGEDVLDCAGLGLSPFPGVSLGGV